MRDSTTNGPTKTVTAGMGGTARIIWRALRRRLVAFVVFFLMVILMQPLVELVIAEELHISMRLSEQVAIFTGSVYLAIYLLGELARAAVITKQYKDAIVIGSLFVGTLFDSLAVAIGLILVTSMAIEARTDNRIKERIATWVNRENETSSG